MLYPVTQGNQLPFKVCTLYLAVPFVALIAIASIGLPSIPAKSSPDLSFSLSVISPSHLPFLVCTFYINLLFIFFVSLLPNFNLDSSKF